MSTQHGDLFGREDLVADVVAEIKKGKHLVLTGAVGCGKSAVLEAALKVIEPRVSEWYQFDTVGTETGQTQVNPAPLPPQPGRRDRVLVYVSESSAKGQFVQIVRRLIATGLVRPSSLDLAKKYDSMPAADVPWKEIRRHINRLSIRDMTTVIVPAIYAYEGKVLVAVDDMTSLTPTQQAFWLSILEHAQLVTCASSRKMGLQKLWWKMKVIDVPALPEGPAMAIIRKYIAEHGMLIESPELYIGHVVKQAGGNPQAIRDMLCESGKEKRMDKRQIREMRHAAGVQYMDFTPVLLICGACIVGTRYLAMGMGDKALYIMAGMAAAVFVAARFFLFKGAGRATG